MNERRAETEPDPDAALVLASYAAIARGSTHDNTVADVYTVEDGQVVGMHAYGDPAEALALD